MTRGLSPRARTAFVVAAFVFSWTLTTHGKYSSSGDEPHYLMIARSLWADRDLDLANNYAQNDGRLLGHDHLTVEGHARPSPAGGLRSVHDIGLPVLLLPVYGAAQAIARLPSDAVLTRFRMTRGLFAYSLISLCLVAVSVWCLSLVADRLVEATGRRTAALVVLLATVSPPIASHTFLVFPEVPALCVTCLVVAFVVQARRPRDAATLLLMAAVLGLLPWMHRKYAFYVGGLAFSMIWLRRDAVGRLSPAARLGAGALFLAPQIAFHAWTWHQWHTLAGPQLSEGLPFSIAGLQGGLAGLWLDRQFGVLAYAPIYLVLPACWAITWRRTWPLLVPLLCLFVPMAAFTEWWAGFSPAARYLVPTLPLCLVPIGKALPARSVRWAIGALAVPQIAIDLFVWQRPAALWPVVAGVNPALHALGAAGRAYEGLLPAVRADGPSIGAMLIAIAAVLLLTAALLVTATRPDARRAG